MSYAAGIKQNQNTKGCNSCNNQFLESRQGFTFFSGNLQKSANENDDEFLNTKFINASDKEISNEFSVANQKSASETGINFSGKAASKPNGLSDGACCADCAKAESEEMSEEINEMEGYDSEFQVSDDNNPEIKSYVSAGQGSGSGIIMGLFDDMLNFYDNIVTPLPNVTTRGVPVNFVVLGNGGAVSISLHGTTEPYFDGGAGSTENVRTARATDCDSCEDDECLLATGTLVLTFHCSPVVTLPSRSEYEHLSPCQIQRVEQWIRDVLSPHEQDHVNAFNTYNGTVREPFSIKTCRSDWGPDSIQPIHERVEEQRRSSAQQLSDDLDPFHSNIDLNCEDE